MSFTDYTLVVGVDKLHLEQLAITWPTWKRHKPSLLQQPMLVVHDDSVHAWHILEVVDHPNPLIICWPPVDVTYEGGDDKWSNPQRYKMLAGFVHVPGRFVKTKYWLKLDTDVVATGMDDWIDDNWFEGDPAIAAHRWAFSKPANKMLELDAWVESERQRLLYLYQEPPLNLRPEPGSERVGHRRIISWCGFFHTRFTLECSIAAEETCGRGKLPVPSQDGFMWYCARRLFGESAIVRTMMKRRGWQHWSTMKNVRENAAKAMKLPVEAG